jgi:hypothetical protein
MKYEENARTLLGKKIRRLAAKMTGAKAAEKTAESTRGKNLVKSSAARQRNPVGKKAMAHADGLACRAKFPYSLKMTR